MKLLKFVGCAIGAVCCGALPVSALAACEVRSGPNTAALVELYTSEGCSSCPPADRQMSALPQALDPGAEVVALALHVGYWDYIGWKDPFAKGAFGDRQNWLARTNKRKAVYTPQFFVGGRDLQASGSALRDEVRRINAVPAIAAIRIRAGMSPSGALSVSGDATARSGANPVALYLAIAESGLVSKVTRGENGGVTLAHDHVVREWIGPIRLEGGSTQVRREIALAPDWNRSKLEVVAFVQDERSASVLQAVAARNCTGS